MLLPLLYIFSNSPVEIDLNPFIIILSSDALLPLLMVPFLNSDQPGGACLVEMGFKLLGLFCWVSLVSKVNQRAVRLLYFH